MRIRISNKAWHLRLVRNVFDLGRHYEPSNLCTYFWLVVGALLTRSFLIFAFPAIIFLPLVAVVIHLANDTYTKWWKDSAMYAITGLLFLVFYGLLAAGFIFFAKDDTTDVFIVAQEERLETFLKVCIVSWLVQAFIFVLACVIIFIHSHQKISDAVNTATTSTVGLAWHFVMAKKNKICPLIEVVKDQ